VPRDPVDFEHVIGLEEVDDDILIGMKAARGSTPAIAATNRGTLDVSGATSLFVKNRAGGEGGPFPTQRIVEMLESGMLSGDEEVSQDRFRWLPISTILKNSEHTGVLLETQISDTRTPAASGGAPIVSRKSESEVIQSVDIQGFVQRVKALTEEVAFLRDENQKLMRDKEEESQSRLAVESDLVALVKERDLYRTQVEKFDQELRLLRAVAGDHETLKRQYSQVSEEKERLVEKLQILTDELNLLSELIKPLGAKS